MPPRKVNPIAEKLLRLIYSGKTTKEKICVATDLKYPTLENVFSRPVISYASLKALKWAGIVTERDETEYRKWVETNGAKAKRRGPTTARPTHELSESPQADARYAEDTNEEFLEPRESIPLPRADGTDVGDADADE